MNDTHLQTFACVIETSKTLVMIRVPYQLIPVRMRSQIKTIKSNIPIPVTMNLTTLVDLSLIQRLLLEVIVTSLSFSNVPFSIIIPLGGLNSTNHDVFAVTDQPHKLIIASVFLINLIQ